MENLPKDFIGVFDSGAGGISVLAEAIRLLPNENFVYFGDSAYTPYGEKPKEWIIQRSQFIAEKLIADGAKAIVIACNTATSVAADALRIEFQDVPIIGVEPALKPATQTPGIQHILVMATPITLRLDKYRRLARKWSGTHEVVEIECPGLAGRIEQGNLDGSDLRELLEELIGDQRGWADAVVLGCTHYGFAADAIRQTVGDIPLFDGAKGTARQLKCKLDEKNLLQLMPQKSQIILRSSKKGTQIIKQYRSLLTEALEDS